MQRKVIYQYAIKDFQPLPSRDRVERKHVGDKKPCKHGWEL